LELGLSIAVLAECAEGAGECDPGLAEVGEQALLPEQAEGLVEVGDCVAPFAVRRRDRRPGKRERGLRIGVLGREIASREVDELPRFLDPALPDERLGQVPVDLDHDPTAGLQSDRHRLAKPLLRQP
jgi:hypothetical protein